MKRSKEFLELCDRVALIDPDAAKWMWNNVKNPRGNTLSSAFYWDSTPQKRPFWNSINEQLKNQNAKPPTFELGDIVAYYLGPGAGNEHIVEEWPKEFSPDEREGNIFIRDIEGNTGSGSKRVTACRLIRSVKPPATNVPLRDLVYGKKEHEEYMARQAAKGGNHE
jgi:hypothetical protein